MSNFCHLHVHSQFSYLDGLGTSEQYISRAKELGQEYCTVSEHGNIDGLIKFQKEADKQKINPILGCEAYIVKDLSTKEKGEKRGHITLLIKNKIGFENLCKMLTIANLDGFYYKPRIDFQLLLDNCEGLVILTGCSSSFLNIDQTEALFSQLKKKLKDDIYLELMPHDFKEQKEHNKYCLELSKKYKIEIVGTNDCHYVNAEDEETQQVLLAMQTQAKWNDKDRFKFNTKGLFLCSEGQMKSKFKRQGILTEAQIEKCLSNTIEVAKKCSDFRIKKQGIFLPVVPKYKKEDPKELLEQLTNAKLYLLFKEEKFTAEKRREYNARLLEELDLIEGKGFIPYFLIIKELIDWCKDNDIMTGAGRGSVGGCLVAYLLGITCVDPIKYNLLFSRFISADRNDLPDVDIDFQDSKRELVRQHLEELYGKNNIASISTFLSMKGKAAIRDVARVFDIPLKEVDTFAKTISYYDDDSILQACKTEEGKAFAKKYPQVIKHALKLEGTIKACVDGEARVLLENDYGRTKCKKIKNLFKDGFKGKKIRAYDLEKDILFFDEIVDVFYQGKKQTIEIECAHLNKKSNKVSVTLDHKILTKKGWVEAGEIVLGDYVATNGIIKINRREKKKNIPWNKGKKGLQVAWNKGLKGQIPWNKGLTKYDSDIIMNSSIRMSGENNPAKLDYVKELNRERSFKHGRYSKEFQDLLKENNKCEICGEIKFLDRHHKDKNRDNNKRENILLVCKRCHNKLHNHSMKINPEMTIHFKKVIAIRDSGLKDTYDIAMKSDNQNFVVNRLIVHNCGSHAAAVIISADDLTKGAKGNLVRRSDLTVSNWDMEDSEYMGLMKLDVLGLNTLSVLDEVKKTVFKNHNKEIIFDKIPLDDKNIYKEIYNGNNTGIFQISAYSTDKLAQQLRADNIFLLSDLMALVRPGIADSGMTDLFLARKNGQEWEKKNKIFEEITKGTYGILCYQEQIMEVVYKMAGLSYSIADKIRKVISKKRDAKEFDQYKDIFIEGCLKQKLSKNEANDFWEMMLSYASYSFNKSHALSYAIMAYWTMWCKYYYPIEFLCANLNYGTDKGKEGFISEAHRLELTVKLPSINNSDSLKWQVKDGNLYIPLIEIKGIGQKMLENRLDKKEEIKEVKIKSKRKGFFDLGIEKISKPATVVKKGKLESILEKIAELKKEENYEELQKYFSFKIRRE